MEIKKINLIKHILTLSIVLNLSMSVSYTITKNIVFFVIPLLIIFYYTYAEKLIQEKSLNNKDVDAKLQYQNKLSFIRVVQLKLGNQQINKELYHFNSYIFKILFVICLFGCIGLLNILKDKNIISEELKLQIIKLGILSILLGLIMIGDEIYVLVKSILKYKKCLFIKIKNNKLYYIEKIDFLSHHKDIVGYEDMYKNYKMRDLEREIIYLKSRYEKITKKIFLTSIYYLF